MNPSTLAVLPARQRFGIRLMQARNTVFKPFGLIDPYTSAQIAVATDIWNAAKAHNYDDLTCASWLGNTEGETSFVLSAWGDHHEAIGMIQWHAARRALIKENTGIDVSTASAVEQFAGVYAECTQPWSSYKHVDDHLRAATGSTVTDALRAKITVLVHELEQSASQSRDIDRRTPMAAYWYQRLGANNPTHSVLVS